MKLYYEVAICFPAFTTVPLVARDLALDYTFYVSIFTPLFMLELRRAPLLLVTSPSTG